MDSFWTCHHGLHSKADPVDTYHTTVTLKTLLLILTSLSIWACVCREEGEEPTAKGIPSVVKKSHRQVSENQEGGREERRQVRGSGFSDWFYVSDGWHKGHIKWSTVHIRPGRSWMSSTVWRAPIKLWWPTDAGLFLTLQTKYLPPPSIRQDYELIKTDMNEYDG